MTQEEIEFENKKSEEIIQLLKGMTCESALRILERLKFEVQALSILK